MQGTTRHPPADQQLQDSQGKNKTFAFLSVSISSKTNKVLIEPWQSGWGSMVRLEESVPRANLTEKFVDT